MSPNDIAIVIGSQQSVPYRITSLLTAVDSHYFAAKILAHLFFVQFPDTRFGDLFHQLD